MDFADFNKIILIALAFVVLVIYLCQLGDLPVSTGDLPMLSTGDLPVSTG